MALSTGASEMRFTAISLSKLSGGPDRTELFGYSTKFSPPDRTEFSLKTGFCCRYHSEM